MIHLYKISEKQKVTDLFDLLFVGMPLISCKFYSYNVWFTK